MSYILAFIFGGIFLWILFRPKKRTSGLKHPDAFPRTWRAFLLTKLPFYAVLSKEDKARFESDVMEFLAQVRITGVRTTVDDDNRLLVASCAVIPVFSFPEWT